MTLEELYIVLSGIGIPARYSHFDNPVSPPYLVYINEEKETFKADDSIYLKEKSIRIELYTKIKDESLEETIENTLENNGLIWEFDETYDENQKLFIIYYYFNI